MAGDHFNLFAETVELIERRVNVGSDPNALEFFVHDRRGENVVFVEQIFHYSFGIGAVDVNVSYRARLIWIERSVEANFGHLLEPVHPVTGQVAQPRFLAFAADPIVKEERFTDGELRRG